MSKIKELEPKEVYVKSHKVNDETDITIYTADELLEYKKDRDIYELIGDDYDFSNLEDLLYDAKMNEDMPDIITNWIYDVVLPLVENKGIILK